MYINWILALVVISYLFNSSLLDPAFEYLKATYNIDFKAQLGGLLAKLPTVDDLLNLNIFDFEQIKNMLRNLTATKQ